MTNRNNRLSSLIVVFLSLLVGCAPVAERETVADPRLDQLVSKVDQSLANQAHVNAQLQHQQQQLDLQQQHLQLLGEDLGKAILEPAETGCPEVEVCSAPEEFSNRMVVGGLEEIWLSDLEFALTARIDTGAATSSLDARNIEQFERDGKRWVRFEIMNPGTNELALMERRLRRTAGLVSSGTTGTIRRPVVKMGVVIGPVSQTAEFILSDRHHEGYQALIGRSILKDVMVVDVSKKNVEPYILPATSAARVGAGR